MQAKRSGKCKETLKNVDRFGTPLTMTYQGKYKYTTVCGGTTTLLCWLVIIVYIIILLVNEKAA
jgi:hypothetical protein